MRGPGEGQRPTLDHAAAAGAKGGGPLSQLARFDTFFGRRRVAVAEQVSGAANVEQIATPARDGRQLGVE